MGAVTRRCDYCNKRAVGAWMDRDGEVAYVCATCRERHAIDGIRLIGGEP